MLNTVNEMALFFLRAVPMKRVPLPSGKSRTNETVAER